MNRFRSEFFGKTTEWFSIPDGLIARVTYGFNCLQGNGEPYFSITGEAWEKDERVAEFALRPKGDDCVSCGCLHDLLPLAPVPALQKAQVFHLFSPTSGPMHYVANAIYWLEQLDKGTPREGDNPERAFKSTVCWGALEGESPSDPLPDAVRLTGPEGRVLWLANRLPHLRGRFLDMIAALDLRAELVAAVAEMRDDSLAS